MSGETSNWVPSRRIRFTIGLALFIALIGIAASVWSPFALLLLLPALGALWAAFIMLQIRRQLSSRGGSWEHRIHELVATRLALPSNADSAVLDIGCGDASLLITLLRQAPAIRATGIDYWGDNWDYAQAACETRLTRLGLNATFRRMDAAKLDFPDASFDAVVSVMCFHEVRAPRGAKLRGPLLAVSEALRVLKPGGTFVLIDRFADKKDYGAPSDLAALLCHTENLHEDSLVRTMRVPWPLSTKRALGPVTVLSGQKQLM
ncbi:MAG TPA: class I SAM-dependent methyltransferase [Rhizomicrobium sp.]|jgi:SAM-dependent methyltransferase|nr:class I SAM-dependent methyltransferase [Rhizomicrobium sp.]